MRYGVRYPWWVALSLYLLGRVVWWLVTIGVIVTLRGMWTTIQGNPDFWSDAIPTWALHVMVGWTAIDMFVMGRRWAGNHL